MVWINKCVYLTLQTMRLKMTQQLLLLVVQVLGSYKRFSVLCLYVIGCTVIYLSFPVMCSYHIVLMHQHMHLFWTSVIKVQLHTFSYQPEAGYGKWHQRMCRPAQEPWTARWLAVTPLPSGVETSGLFCWTAASLRVLACNFALSRLRCTPSYAVF